MLEVSNLKSHSQAKHSMVAAQRQTGRQRDRIEDPETNPTATAMSFSTKLSETYTVRKLL